MKTKLYIVLLIVVVAAAGCRLIDDDLTACGTDYLINYEMRLVTEVHTTIDENLSSDIEASTITELKRWSDPYFSGHAHDLDMNFYSLAGTDELLHHKHEIIDARAKTYTLYIPRQDYQHIAVVNIDENTEVNIMDSGKVSTMHLTQRDAKELPSHHTAIFAARIPMRMEEMSKTEDLTFEVHLYMVSSAVAIVQSALNKTSAKITKVVLNGTASGFYMNDSIFTFERNTPICAERLSDRCFTIISFPSRDSLSSGTKVPMRYKEEDNSLWQVTIYTTTADGKTAENVLSFHKPLKAGTMEIIRVSAHDNGAISVEGNTDVGVSVEIDWGEGDTQELITG